MNFKPELAAKVMAGEKTVTRRHVSDNPRSPWWRERCLYQRDKVFTVNPGRGKANIGHARVTGLRQITLGHLSDEEAQREGFANRAEFEAAFAAINGGAYDPTALVWRINFKAVPATNGALVWRINFKAVPATNAMRSEAARLWQAAYEADRAAGRRPA